MKKFFPVLVAVLLVAAVFVVPVSAQGIDPVEPPVFDWAEISTALQTLLTAILLPLATYAVKWMFVHVSFEKEKLSAEQQWAFERFLKTCVYAAEQMSLSGFISGKFEYVIDLAEAWLEARNIDMDIEEIRARIEAMVAQEFNLDYLMSPSAEPTE